MCEKEEGKERRSLKIKFSVFALGFGVFLSPTGLALKTNLKLPVFWILKGDDADQQNTVSRLQKRISAVPKKSLYRQGSVYQKENSSQSSA